MRVRMIVSFVLVCLMSVGAFAQQPSPQGLTEKWLQASFPKGQIATIASTEAEVVPSRVMREEPQTILMTGWVKTNRRAQGLLRDLTQGESPRRISSGRGSSTQVTTEAVPVNIGGVPLYVVFSGYGAWVLLDWGTDTSDVPDGVYDIAFQLSTNRSISDIWVSDDLQTVVLGTSEGSHFYTGKLVKGVKLTSPVELMNPAWAMTSLTQLADGKYVCAPNKYGEQIVPFTIGVDGSTKFEPASFFQKPVRGSSSSGTTTSLALSGKYLFDSDVYDQIRVHDLSSATKPYPVKVVANFSAAGMTASGNTLYTLSTEYGQGGWAGVLKSFKINADGSLVQDQVFAGLPVSWSSTALAVQGKRLSFSTSDSSNRLVSVSIDPATFGGDMKPLVGSDVLPSWVGASNCTAMRVLPTVNK